MLVADGARAETLDILFELKDKLFGEVGPVPLVLLINKSDLRASWTIEPKRLEQLRAAGWQVFETSAKTGAGVDAAFELLASRLLAVTAE